MFSKFEARMHINENWRSAYAMNTYYIQRHSERRKRFIESMANKLMCQECGGSGQEEIDRVDGHVIWGDCGWCDGTGYVTPWERGMWLRLKKR